MSVRTAAVAAGVLTLVLPLAASLASDPPAAAKPAAAATAAAPASAPAADVKPGARPPQPAPKNLKILPKDWTRSQVVDVMKTWTSDLGVRCQYCHVGQEGQPFSEWDFAADDKDTKRRARDMFQLLDEINHRLGGLSNLHGTGPAPLATCGTCHRGVSRPRRIEDVFEETRATAGMDAAIKQYREMRTESSVSGSYDFSARPLVREAHRRMDAQDGAGAKQILDLTLDLGLDGLMVRMTRVQAAMAQGDQAGALAELDKAAALPLSADEKAFVAEQRAEILKPKQKTP